MQLAKVMIVADVLTAEPDSGSFMRVWRTVPEKPVDWTTPVRWTGQWLHKVGGQVLPTEGDGELGILMTEEVLQKMRGALALSASSGLTIFMSEMDAYGLLPEMVTPRVPLDLTDLSVDDAHLDMVVGRVNNSLALPPFVRIGDEVKRKW